MAKEYASTCKRCATVWYVPREIVKARKPNRLEIAGAKMNSAGVKLTTLGLFGGKRGATKAQRLEDRRQVILDNERCPNCGSVSFSQRRG